MGLNIILMHLTNICSLPKHQGHLRLWERKYDRDKRLVETGEHTSKPSAAR